MTNRIILALLILGASPVFVPTIKADDLFDTPAGAEDDFAQAVDPDEAGTPPTDEPLEERVDTLTQDLKKLYGRYEELEFRLNQLEKRGATIAPASGNASGLSEDDAAILKMMTTHEANSKQEAVKKLRDEKTKEAVKTAPSLASGPAVASYDAAFALYKKADYSKAEKAFAFFIKQNPKDKMVHQALYWQGDCQLKTNQLNTAKVSFVQCYQKDQKGAKTPDALFGLGQVLLKENKQQQACTAWKKLEADFPKMPADLKKKLQDAKKAAKC